MKIKPSKTNKILLIIKNYLAQGMLYMEIEELFFKISMTLIPASLLYIYTPLNIFLSFFIAHTINYLINGQFNVLLRYVYSQEHVNIYKVEKINLKLAELYKRKFFLDVLVTGSGSKDQMNSSSDIDLRIYYNKSFISYLKVCLALLNLRIYAILNSIPIDVYAFNRVNFLDKLDSDEIPISIFNNKKLFNLSNRKIIHKKFSPLIK